MTLLLRASRVKPLPPATAAGDGFRFGELRQRSVNGRDSFVDLAVTAVGDGYVTETVESLELKRVLGNDSIRIYVVQLVSAKRSPVSSFLEKVLHGNSVCSTTTVGDEKGRERVYDTIFRLPWRCELDSDDHLEASENKVRHLSSFYVEYACDCEFRWWTNPAAITLSACIVSHYNALPALLVSNNFSEIKSYVFKGYSKDNVHSMVYSDSIERFHISAFVLFVLAQNILEAEGPWFGSFISTLHMQTEDAKKKLTFVPLAPACVVIRVLAPVYAASLPYNPLPWRLFWILLFSAITYIMLTSLKVLIGMVLRKHARWYVNRCQRRKLHAD
ncbi:hypothetical protein JHK85_037409 [Glycine max]|nr:hypothetical protein JHK85_037409 [Glycine max]